MIDKERCMKEAEQFYKEYCCYIHTEMKNGKNCETVLAGDSTALLYGICGEISRVAQLSGQTFDSALETIREMHEMNGGAKKC